MAVKVINSYTFNHAQTIDSRSSNIGDETVIDQDTLHVTNIDLSKMGTTINVSSPYDFKSIFTNFNKLNKWSWFGPYSHSVDLNNKSIIHTLKTTYNFGDFAAYNQDAVTPFFEEEEGNVTDYSYWEGQSGSTTCGLAFAPHLGEMDMHALSGSTKVKVIVYEHGSTTEKGSALVDYMSYDSNWVNTGDDVTGPVPVNSISISNGTNNFDVKCYITDNVDGELIKLGDTLELTVSVTEKQPNVQWHVDDGDPNHTYILGLTDSGNGGSSPHYYFAPDNNRFSFHYDGMTLYTLMGNPVQTSNINLSAMWSNSNGDSSIIEIFSGLSTDSNGSYTWPSRQYFQTQYFDLDDRNEVSMYFSPSGG